MANAVETRGIFGSTIVAHAWPEQVQTNRVFHKHTPRRSVAASFVVFRDLWPTKVTGSAWTLAHRLCA